MLRHCAVLFVVVLVGSVAQAADGTAGKLIKATGQVTLRAPGAATDSAGSAGASLVPGTLVKTGADGNAEVQFDDGTTLRLSPSSQISLSSTKRQAKKNTVLLFFGRLWSKVTPSKNGDTNYEVTTANAVCGVRGTQFETQVGDDGSVRMQVTEGKVAVGNQGESGEQLATPGQQVEATESGVDKTEPTESGKYEDWQKQKRERLRTGGESIVKQQKQRIMSKKEKLEALRKRQDEIVAKRKQVEQRVRGGDSAAIPELKKLNQELAQLSDAIAALGDEAQASFGLVDHFADLAGDPRFKMVSRKYIEAEAASLRRVKADLDKMVAEGTDMSIESMDKMLDDMSKGKPTLKDKKGSAKDDLFGGDDMDMH